MSNNDGGTAFPSPTFLGRLDDGRPIYEDGPRGMTLRDWFAGLAIQAIIQREGTGTDVVVEEIVGPDSLRDTRMFAPKDAARAYIIADAMLAARQC